MKAALRKVLGTAAAVAAVAGAVPACASDDRVGSEDSAVDAANAAATIAAADPASPPVAGFDLAMAVQAASPQQGEGRPPQGTPSVFDDNWINVGIGAGLIPTYSGSNDYFVFPLPLLTGRVGGVGFRPSGAGMVFDVLSPQPSVLQQATKPQVSFGPAFRLRVERAVDSRDEVVEAAGRLDRALELGLAAGVTFPGVLHSLDSVTIGTSMRWDILGAHKGQVIEPSVSYLSPLSLGILVQFSATMEIVDDNFARYYQSVNPVQSAASGLPVFDASGGLNRVGANLTMAFDLDGNALNGGFNIFTVAGYSRMLGDGARTPFTATRGNPNQFLIGLGLGYTF